MSLDLDNTHLSKFKALEVKVGEFRSFEAAVKKFRKIVEKEGTIKHVLERRSFMKPSAKRHRKKAHRCFQFGLDLINENNQLDNQ